MKRGNIREIMHKPEYSFKRCLKEGAARHEKGSFFACLRKEDCHIKADLGCMSPFCGTPLNEAIRKEERQRAKERQANSL